MWWCRVDVVVVVTLADDRVEVVYIKRMRERVPVGKIIAMCMSRVHKKGSKCSSGW